MGLLTFQKPDKIVLQKANDFEGTFEFKPLEQGFGVTVGNALRRVLLSSLEGTAIVGVKVSGVDHEFSTIRGVLEDITEIILNLKQVRLKKIMDDENASDKIFITIKDKETFTAGDIEKHTNVYRVMNPDLVICNIEPVVTLELEITIQRGKGYVPAEEHDFAETAVGFIPVDAVFTPIKNVKYNIENTRVEQRTDYEKLMLDVTTDGTIHPEEAVKEAARILIQHLMLISDENITFDTSENKVDDIVDEHVLQMRKLLKTNLEDLDLAVRAYNCLKRANVHTLSDLLQYSADDLLEFKNFGQKSADEVCENLKARFNLDLRQ